MRQIRFHLGSPNEIMGCSSQLAQLDAAKTSFFSNVSHELSRKCPHLLFESFIYFCLSLGTPLTLILGPIQDAVSVTRETKLKETLKMALRNVSRLSRLVDSLMDFTRIEAGKLLGTSPACSSLRLCSWLSIMHN